MCVCWLYVLPGCSYEQWRGRQYWCDGTNVHFGLYWDAASENSISARCIMYGTCIFRPMKKQVLVELYGVQQWMLLLKEANPLVKQRYCLPHERNIQLQSHFFYRPMRIPVHTFYSLTTTYAAGSCRHCLVSCMRCSATRWVVCTVTVSYNTTTTTIGWSISEAQVSQGVAQDDNLRFVSEPHRTYTDRIDTVTVGLTYWLIYYTDSLCQGMIPSDTWFTSVIAYCL